jgi:hypothetical protein
MIASFLADRTMNVEVDGVKLSPRDVLPGVSQGSVTSPIFFAMFIDSLRLVIQHCQFHFYADDLQIYLSGDRNDIDSYVAHVNEDLEAVLRWSVENGLTLNASKTQAMLISNDSLPDLFLGGVLLD